MFSLWQQCVHKLGLVPEGIGSGLNGTEKSRNPAWYTDQHWRWMDELDFTWGRICGRFQLQSSRHSSVSFLQACCRRWGLAKVFILYDPSENCSINQLNSVFRRTVPRDLLWLVIRINTCKRVYIKRKQSTKFVEVQLCSSKSTKFKTMKKMATSNISLEPSGPYHAQIFPCARRTSSWKPWLRRF